MKMLTRRMLHWLPLAVTLLFSDQLQAERIDSILSLLESTSRDDTLYVNLANAATLELLKNNLVDSAASFANHTLAIAQQLQFRSGEAQSKLLLGQAFIYQSKFAEGMEWIVKARNDFESLHNKKGVADCSFQQGIVLYYTDKNYHTALEDFTEARSIYEELGDKQRTSAADYLMGLCYAALGEHSKAESSLQQALEMKKEIGDQQGYHECLGGLANVYLSTGRYGEAKKLHEECLTFFRSEDNPDGIAESYLGLGKAYYASGETGQAVVFLKQAYDQGKRAGYLPAVLSSSKLLQEIFAKEHDYAQAFFFLKEYHAARDSEFNADVARKIAALQYDLDITRQKSENDRLRQQQKTDRILRGVMLAGIAILIFLSVLWYQRFRFKQRTNLELEKVNDDLKNAMNQLKKTQSQLLLTEKLASVGQLTAGIAHEINNPINFVTGNINPLKRNFESFKKLLQKVGTLHTDDDARAQLTELETMSREMDFKYTLEESEKLLSGIEEGSRRTAAIVKGLRQFSRMDDDARKPADIREGIESTLLLLQNKLKFQRIEVVQSIADLPQIQCYPGQLNQVFMNLLTNAIDAIGSDGKIFITAGLSGDRLKISIRDTGKGMTEEVRQKIFDPFFTTKEVGKGTGLGLSISYGIIEKHGGTMEVHSAQGQGSEFVILLPR